MCGISGIFNNNGNLISEELQFKIDIANTSLKHRGPDDVGKYVNNNIALGHTRLSIIDIGSGGHQPLFNENKTLCIIFNGEIYNYLELKEKLVQKGHIFSGKSDGEVLLHLFEDYSYECLQYIEGMFAFAIYDIEKNELFISRDRIGEKPLYYTWFDGNLYFASEIQTLKKVLPYKFQLSLDGVICYLANTQTPAPMTIFNNIFKLPPAHYAIIKKTDTKLEAKPYWKLDYTYKRNILLGEAVEDLDRLISKEISKIILSDVPIGVTLSGGIDSSIVAAMINKVSNNKVMCFTLGSALYNNDPEIQRAIEVARAYSTKHYIKEFKAINFQDCERIIKAFSEPIGIFDIFHLFLFKEFIVPYRKVVISGNGADEIFGGYSTYNSLIAENNNINNTDIYNYLITWYKSTINDIVRVLFKKELTNQIVNYNPLSFLNTYLDIAKFDNLLDARLFIDLLIAVNHSASLTDITGMANSLEVRSPFLSKNIIEYSATLPIQFKVKDHNPKNNKYILRLIANRYFGNDMAFSKKFFCGNFINYFEMMRGPWRKNIENLFYMLADDDLGEYISINKLNILWKKFLLNNTNEKENMFLRKIFILLLWKQSI